MASEADPPLTLSRRLSQAFNGGSQIRITAGNDPQQDFWVAENLLRTSPYFEKMLKNGFKEAKERHITLPDDKIQTVQAYLAWLCSGRALKDNHQGGMDIIDGFVDMYILGDKFQDSFFKDTVIDAMIAAILHHRYKFLPEPKKVFENTPQGSPLRALVVSLYYGRLNDETLRQLYPFHTNEEFFFELTRLSLKKAYLTPETDSWYTSCRFHGHKTARSCYKLYDA